ncbi:MAG TPA: hypothetical protein VIM69_09955 [Opitutaceae bacterium]
MNPRSRHGQREMKFLPSLLCAGFALLISPLPAQVIPDTAWNLSQIPPLTDSGPRTYRFTIDYDSADSVGNLVQRQRVTADYTRGLPNDEVRWKNVSVATATGAADPFGAPKKSEFMDGFQYAANSETLAPDFFKTFPPSAFMERNLVWDTAMFEMFGQKSLNKLRLNEPFHTMPDQDVKMPGLGTFRNHDIILEWIGIDHRNGHDCAVVNYRAFFNPIDINSGGMTLKARSDYWGQIWISFADRQIEYATLYEEVVGQMKAPGQTSAAPMNVFRIGSFEPVNAAK